MKASKLREHSIDELRQLREDTAKEILELRMKKGVGDSSGQPLRIRTLRRDLARVETVVRGLEMNNHG